MIVSDAAWFAPVSLAADEVYTFDINNTGAAAQAYLTSFEFNVVPEPGSFATCLVVGVAIALRRRRMG